MRKHICVDFDGVLHNNAGPWRGPTVITGLAVPGAMEWLAELIRHFNVSIHSGRSPHAGAIDAMKAWLLRQGMTPAQMGRMEFPIHKPPALVFIDDRAISFRAPTFPTIEEIARFHPWNKRA